MFLSPPGSTNGVREKRPSTEVYRILILGAPSVGKSAIVVRFLTKRFIGEYASTTECYKHTVCVEDDPVTLEVLDAPCPGQITSKSLREHEIRWADGFLLVYDVSDRDSFQPLPQLISQVEETRKQPALPMVIVANKADLEDSRQISTDEGRQLAAEINCSFWELSARTEYQAVENAFTDLCGTIRRKRIIDRVGRRRSTGQLKHVFSKVISKLQH